MERENLIGDAKGKGASGSNRAVRNLENTVRRIQTAKISLIADNLADVYDQLNYLHPFREGNGRSQKVFFSLVCRPRGLQLNWSEIPSNEHNLAAQQAMRGDISLLRRIPDDCGQVGQPKSGAA
jgi:fido (protein-threonine AMPylation protein)